VLGRLAVLVVEETLSTSTPSEVEVVRLGVRVGAADVLLPSPLFRFSEGDEPRCSLCLYMTWDRTFLMVSPSLKSSGWLATTN
jgi:hypothetical protein